MPKPVIRSFFVIVIILIIPSVFAAETLSAFHRQEDINYPEPIGEESYFATKAPMPSKASGYFGLNLNGGIIPLKSEITINNISNTKEKISMIYGAGVCGGYGINLRHLYLAGELGGAFSILKKTIDDVVNGNAIKLEVKQNITGYLDFIPGYMNYARDFLLYGRLGLGAGLFDLKFSNTTSGVNDSINKVTLGWRLGLGIERAFSETFSWRLEYVHTMYKEASGTINNHVYKLKPSTAHQVNLGIVFHI